MESLSTQQRLKILSTFYRNKESIEMTKKELQDCFGHHICPTESGILAIARRFEETGSIAVEDDEDYVLKLGKNGLTSDDIQTDEDKQTSNDIEADEDKLTHPKRKKKKPNKG